MPFSSFRQECRAAGKKLMIWTVNEPEYMMEVGARRLAFSSGVIDYLVQVCALGSRRYPN